VKITSIELFRVPPRWLFVKLSTDEGISGWGEPIVEGRADTVAAAVRELSGQLIGSDPERIEDLWQVFYRGAFYRGGPVLMSAIAGVDQALWDIKGKAHGMAVHELLGGRVRDTMRVYSWIGGESPEAVAAVARERAAAGYTAVKMTATDALAYLDSHDMVDEVVRRVQAVREANGPGFGIAVDFHGRAHRAMAKLLVRELEPFDLLFVEEPVLSENLEALAEVAREARMPIALGERLYSRWDFKRVFMQGVVDIVQPDLSHAGGITEVKKIAAMAEAFDVAVAPHCPLGPISLASALQIDACCANAVIQEQSLGIHYNAKNDLLDYLADPAVFAYDQGSVRIPAAPGLGITINESAVREASARWEDWKNPLWRNRDGSVAEW
jgi:galactonate dehydratase